MNESQPLDLCDRMLDPYNREIVLQLQIETIEPMAMAAADELLQLAEDTKTSHTIGDGEWPESEQDAKAEHDKLFELANNLKAAFSLNIAQQQALLCDYYAARQE